MLIALLLAASGARADLFTSDDPIFSRPTLAAGNIEFYTYSPNVSVNRPWIARQLSARGGARSAGPSLLSDQRTMDAFAAASRPSTALSSPDSSSPGSDLLSLAGTDMVPIEDRALAGVLGDAELSEDEMISLVEGVPELAFLLADYLIDFSDGTMRLVQNLRNMIASKASIDWAGVFRSRRALTSEREEALSKRAANLPVKKDDADDPSQRGGEVKKVVRSLFKIVLGITIGLFLWLFVRRV